MISNPLEESYLGTGECPEDFDAFWKKSLDKLDAVEPAVELLPANHMAHSGIEFLELRFHSVGGASIFSKVLKPSKLCTSPNVLMLFHGFGASSGNWVDNLVYVAAGWVVVAMDCRGQSGASSDPVTADCVNPGAVLTRGMQGRGDDFYFRDVILDTVQLTRVLSGLFPGARLSCYGPSQGGALALVCSALVPGIQRCVAMYPFLSDFKKVWEAGSAQNAYAEIGDYIRKRAPIAGQERALFDHLAYIDTRHFASRVRCETLFGIALKDVVCPPLTQWAVYNNLRCPKHPVVYQNHGHEGLPGLPDIAFQFLTVGLAVSAPCATRM